ncbi:TetR/AcrR family transcriptional regulator [Saccharopolyspora sp. K220]|uniref:TetR/AcrR family transcriptional regulator n=1 Tax=Saccharopolyspora soli TaxID=2926618 RepID=UPI001F578DA0|nr:TetR/AcrR family transcriptional regulator [Saccharopolyspora soli]MCI2422999.1 TetR/AcrR family transcriptional regulator [Saccharopolyspora soli]
MRSDAQRNRERILQAAREVFTEGGPRASTEEVARRAGVAIGTVFRHFPTKADLLKALMKQLLRQITNDAADLVTRGDPTTALFQFFTQLVERTTANRTAVSLLAEEGLEVSTTDSLGSLTDVVQHLLVGGQQAGAIRTDVRLDEVMALLDCACQGALRGGWDCGLRERTLDIIFRGLTPQADQ